MLARRTSNIIFFFFFFSVSDQLLYLQKYKFILRIYIYKVSFNDKVDYVYKKAQQCLYLVRKLWSFRVGRHVLESVYRCLVDSALSLNIVTWYGNLSVKNRARLARVVNTASKIIGAEQKQLCDLYHLSVCRMSLSILHDKTHPLNFCFQHLPSGRRLKVPLAKKNVYKKSFIPTAVSVLNAKF